MELDLQTKLHQYAATFGIPDPAHATLEQVVAAINKVPHDSIVHPEDMKADLLDSLPEMDPKRALLL